MRSTVVQYNEIRRPARLRRRIADNAWRLDKAGRKLVEDLLEATAEAERRIAEQRARIRYLEDLSITDELTGLLNRRGFHVELDRALARAQRQGETGVLLLCDLNNFKPINDTFGHPAGDAVLCAVAGLLCRRTRRSDYVARLGGDEFAVLMTDTAPTRAGSRAARLQAQLNQLRIEWEDARIPVSAGFGLEAYDGLSRPDSLMIAADQALYRGKQPRLVEGR
ncbi:MAG: GGDEF domain-containing protein [Rhodospirillales bacterium]|nr:GGDEF domain-containing protein [Rhodospirillales bacterium]MDH3910454.1 GGDEF domain-containing protein [Rhodospirillales bacterium]MDH3916862.1 GGDEF domain-containing protein [Rhodospirillales bacterium]